MKTKDKSTNNSELPLPLSHLLYPPSFVSQCCNGFVPRQDAFLKKLSSWFGVSEIMGTGFWYIQGEDSQDVVSTKLRSLWNL